MLTQITLLTEKEVADFLGKSVITLARWRRLGHGPAFLRFQRSVRYRREDVAAFMQANRVLPGGAQAA